MSDKVKNQCPNCGKKDSVWSGDVFLLEQSEIDFINNYHEPKSIAYCKSDNCGSALLSKYKIQLKKKKESLVLELQGMDFGVIPVITLPNPQGWEYDIIDLVNAQTTTGTGAITEIFAQVADFMGEQSERHNSKIQIAVNTCKNQLRTQALSLGANAIIGCDVDITTGGVGNGLIIVCMSGTAIKIRNMNIISEAAQSEMKKIIELVNEIASLKTDRNTI